MSLKDQLEKEVGEMNNRDYDFYKMVEGENKMRILSEGEVVRQYFFGKGIKPSICYGKEKGDPYSINPPIDKQTGEPKKPSIKYTCYVLDRVDNKVKLADLPYSVIKSVSELQQDSDWVFDEFPMPYDIKVNYKPNESPANMYTVIGSPKREDLPQEILEQLNKLMETANPKDLIQKKKDKQMREHMEQGIWIDPTTLKPDLTEEEIAQIKALKANVMEKEVLEDDIDVSDIPF